MTRDHERMSLSIAGLTVTHYRLSPAARTIVLCRPIGVSHGIWKPQFPSLHSNNVLTLDYPGHGYSAPPKGGQNVRSFSEILSRCWRTFGIDEADVLVFAKNCGFHAGDIGIAEAEIAEERDNRARPAWRGATVAHRRIA